MKKFLSPLILLYLWLMIPGNADAQCTLDPPLDLGPDIASCEGLIVILDAGQGYTSYIWNTGAPARVINVTNSGVYFVRVTDSAGCIGTDTIVVTISEDLSVDLGPDRVGCFGDSVLLDAGGGPFTYEWPNGTTDQTLWVTQPGTYWVEINDSIQCKASDTIEVTFATPPDFSIGPDTVICEGGSANLDAGPGYASYIWSNGMVGQLITVTAAGSYDVTVTDNNGCEGVSNNDVTVSTVSNPATPTITWDGEVLISSPGDNYQWYLEGNLIPGATSMTYEPEEEGNYSVRVISDLGCASSSSSALLISFTITKDQIVQVFTPDGDGYNEFFFIEHISSFPNNSLVIMNRWGQELWRTEGYMNDWNGVTMDGKKLPEGTYFYILDLGEGDEAFTGFVELRR